MFSDPFFAGDKMKRFAAMLFLLVALPAHAQEQTTVGAACTTGRNAADWDTVMQCVNGTWQRAPLFLGAATDNAGAAVTCGASTAGTLRWSGTVFQGCDGSGWVNLTADTTTALLLHLDGSNGSTTFTDSSSNAISLTVNGNPVLSTAASKFGGASGYFTGGSTNASNYVIAADNTALNFGTGDFTIDFWFYATAHTGGDTLLSSHYYEAGYSGNWSLFYTLGSGLAFYSYNSNTAGTVESVITSYALQLSTWYHVALVRSGTTLKVYINGTQYGSGTVSKAISASGLKLGNDAVNNRLTGYLDEVRLSNVARWTANFTPPTTAY